MRFAPVLLLALGFVAEAQAPSALAPFTLYASFQQEPSPQVRETIREELDSLITPIGWHIEWGSVDSAGVSLRLAVAHFKGGCDADNVTTYGRYPWVLGETHVISGKISPFTDVYCDAIRAFLADALMPMNREKRQFVFGRAVGRVLAHELFHILANEKGHGRKGVAEPMFRQDELISDNFRFDSKQVKELRAHLASAVVTAYEGGQSRGASLFISSGCSGCHGLKGEGTRWAPALTEVRGSYQSGELSARLANRNTDMYRRAKEFNLVWPALDSDETRALIFYLRNPQQFAFDRSVE